MAWREREIVEFGGLRTYFFPNLALYAAHNSQLIAMRPDRANPVAAYVFGASEKVPTEQETLSVLFPDRDDAETVATGMDACFALGGNFHSHYTKLNEHLNTRLKRTHDLDDPDSTQKTDKIRAILEKITAQNLAKKKFEEICNLCPLDLDFDAFVFCKLLGYYGDEEMMKEYGEELEMIKGNVMEVLEGKNPELADLMKNGPAPELSRLIASPLDSDTAQKLVKLTQEAYTDDLTSSESTESLTKLARLNTQLHFLVLRSICSSSPESWDIISLIPEDIRRRHVFPLLQMNRVEKTMDLAKGIIEAFLAENPKFDGWTLPNGILELIENPYSKNAITDILDAFRFAVRNSKEAFGEDVLLVPESKIHNSHLVQSVDTALRFTTWILQNYHGSENPQNFSRLQDLYFLDSSKIHIYVAGVKKAFEPEPTPTEIIREEPKVVKKKEEELIIEDAKVTLLLKSAASELEKVSTNMEQKQASRWDCLDREYSKERKNRGVSRGRALKIQTNNEQNLPADSSRRSASVRPYYKEHEHHKHHKVSMIGQEQIPEKKSSSYDFKYGKQPLILQENPESISDFTDEQWALNAPPPPPPKPEAPPPKPADLVPRQRYVKPPRILKPPHYDFRQTGFTGAKICNNFGIDAKTTRRIFGGIGVGEFKKYSGFV